MARSDGHSTTAMARAVAGIERRPRRAAAGTGRRPCGAEAGIERRPWRAAAGIQRRPSPAEGTAQGYAIVALRSSGAAGVHHAGAERLCQRCQKLVSL
eukprot:364509-Chlamydomonas_euryale.AAC.2